MNEVLTKGEKRKRQREKMFNAQNGKCHWCGHSMTLKNSREHGNPPPNFATFEHLYDRFSKEREDWKEHIKLGIPRLVLACYKCNHSRAQEREREHIEEHKKRSKRPERSDRGGPERALIYSTKGEYDDLA